MAKAHKAKDLDLKWLANNEVQVLIDKDRIAQVLTHPYQCAQIFLSRYAHCAAR